jgi:hypothetical protein
MTCAAAAAAGAVTPADTCAQAVAARLLLLQAEATHDHTTTKSSRIAIDVCKSAATVKKVTLNCGKAAADTSAANTGA